MLCARNVVNNICHLYEVLIPRVIPFAINISPLTGFVNNESFIFKRTALQWHMNSRNQYHNNLNLVEVTYKKIKIENETVRKCCNSVYELPDIFNSDHVINRIHLPANRCEWNEWGVIFYWNYEDLSTFFQPTGFALEPTIKTSKTVSYN